MLKQSSIIFKSLALILLLGSQTIKADDLVNESQKIAQLMNWILRKISGTKSEKELAQLRAGFANLSTVLEDRNSAKLESALQNLEVKLRESAQNITLTDMDIKQGLTIKEEVKRIIDYVRSVLKELLANKNKTNKSRTKLLAALAGFFKKLGNNFGKAGFTNENLENSFDLLVKEKSV